jgi:hypothetical protein
MSRIDLPVYYPPLDIKARLQIGKQLLRDIEESRSPQISTEAEARWEANLPHEELNGHEIKSSKLPMPHDGFPNMKGLLLEEWSCTFTVSRTNDHTLPSPRECTSHS